MMNLQRAYNLKNIIRYNNKIHITSENVAEHSFFVSLISLELCNMFDIEDSEKLRILSYAILHDMPEIDLNDITHDVKVRLGLYQFLKGYEDDYFASNFPLQRDLMTNPDETCKLIVDIADLFSVKQFVDRELSIGNKSTDIYKIQSDVEERFEVFKMKVKELFPKKYDEFLKVVNESHVY